MTTTHEAMARARKALRLADTLTSHGAAAETAEALTDTEWAKVARVAGVRVPSAATRALVVDLLRDRERRRPMAPANVPSLVE